MTDTIERTASDTQGRTASDVKERITAILPIIREHATQTESDRRVAQPVIDALQEAGAFKVTVPRRFGGYQLTLREIVDINAIVARGDGSTSWVTTLTSVCSWMTGLFGEQAQNDVWGENPDARVCGVLTPSATAVREEGGLRVSGSWGFASGSNHSQWALLGVPVVDESGAQIDQGLALVPMSDVSIEDTWYVAGMQGTGSNTIVAKDVFIPYHRIISINDAVGGTYATPFTDEILYRGAFVPTLAIILAGPMTGMAQAALDIVLTSLAKGRGIAYTFYDRSIDSGSTQVNIAEAAEVVDTSVLHMQRTADAIDAHAAAGTYPDLVERARARMDTGYIARKTREAVDELMSIQGAGGFAQANQLQRYWRDLNTASRHAVIGPAISNELYGRALLGIPEQVTPLI